MSYASLALPLDGSSAVLCAVDAERVLGSEVESFFWGDFLLLRRISDAGRECPDPSLEEAIVHLVESMRRVDQGPASNVSDRLRDAISQSYEICTYGGSKSLENQLQVLRLDKVVTKSNVAREIDKLSKYLELCHDLTRLQPRTR